MSLPAPKFIQWSSGLNLGIEQIDEKHQGLVEIMNELHQMCEEGQPLGIIKQRFQDLIDASTAHFSSEEDFMQSIHYPSFAQHKAAHDQLIRRPKEELQHREKQQVGTITQGRFSFFRFWLTSHIQGADRKYSHFASGKR